MNLNRFQSLAAAGLLVSVSGFSADADASSVVFDTSLGNITVDLTEVETPKTVENFLGYVERGDYNGTIFHRSAELQNGDPFVLQGGGFEPNGNSAPTQRPTQPPVENEPGISNTRGTLALAKLGSDPNSGTNQFFFNLGDNSQNLDNQNGGFTVFGRVIEGLDIVDAIAALSTVNGGGAFSDLPFRNSTQPTSFEEVEFVLINSVSVVPETPTDDGGDVSAPTNPTAVPTPSAFVAGLLGLGALAGRRRR